MDGEFNPNVTKISDVELNPMESKPDVNEEVAVSVTPAVPEPSDAGAESVEESVEETVENVSASVVFEAVAPEGENSVAGSSGAPEGAGDSVGTDAAVETVQSAVQEDGSPEYSVVGEVRPATEKSAVNYAALTLAELTDLFQKLMDDADRMKRSKEAEAIKAAFYKKLSREKAGAGLNPAVDEPSAGDAEQVGDDAVQPGDAEPAEDDAVQPGAAGAAEQAEDDAVQPGAAGAEVPVMEVEGGVAGNSPAGEMAINPFVAIEEGFKQLYNSYKKERAEYNRQLESEKDANLVKKRAIIEDLKALVEKQDDVSAAFPELRAIQARWREVGPVPAQSFRNLNSTYQLYIEQFYDKVKINRDLRDLDFKKNLQIKEEFCLAAEKLAENEDIVYAFKELQKLHEQWKEYGPVAKEYREKIWDRFKAATAAINKRYQGYFENRKSRQVDNLAAKTALCEKVEAMADKEDIKSSNEWNALSKAIEDIQKEWRTIGFASKKENQSIYDRFRAACDRFYEKKRQFYSGYKNQMSENLEKKMALVEQAEAIKGSTDWKNTTDMFISLQKQWKEIGAVPRKKSEQLWTRFRAACDEFFAERDKNAGPKNDFYANLRAKKALVAEIMAFESSDPQVLADAATSFAERWGAIGHVPFKEKEAIAAAYREAMQARFPDYSFRNPSRGQGMEGGARQKYQKNPLSERDRLVQRYNALQQEIDTSMNNIGFFAASKGSAPLIQQIQTRIDESRKKLRALEEKIRECDATAEVAGEVRSDGKKEEEE